MTSASMTSLAADLREADFTVVALRELWGEDAADALARDNRVPALRVLRLRIASGVAGPIDTLARVFLLGTPVPASDLDRALPRLGSGGAEALGLVTLAGTEALPRLDLRPYSFVDALGEGEWWISSDLGEAARGGELGEDHVLGVGGATLTLAGQIIPERMELALDLGTGCGLQALHLSRFADRVIATDISERALRVAAFNAELNGVTNIEFREGSLFEPVSGERFDRIVSNPPFVITPRVEGVPAYEYRDGGLEGDAIVAAMMREAPRHLREGGLAQMLGNWEYRGEGDAFDRLEGWLDAGTDAWVIERERQDPARYAETWIRDGGTREGTAEFARLLELWLEDFERRGVSAVGFGYVLLRRRDGEAAPWRRLERVGGSLAASGGGIAGHLAQALAAREWHAARSDAELALESLRVSGDVTEERHYWPGAEDPSAMILRQGAGFGRQVELDTGLAAIVGASDGTLPIGALTGAIAQLLEVDAGDLTAELMPRLRELLETGFLVPEAFAEAEAEAEAEAAAGRVTTGPAA